MKKLTINGEVFGPYNEVLELDDRYRCDGSDLPFVVVGENGVIEDWDGPLPSLEVPVSVPEEVTMRQARLALLNANLLDDVNVAINSLSEPGKTQALIEWEYSSTVKRNSQLISIIGPLLDLSWEDIDSLFIAAADL